MGQESKPRQFELTYFQCNSNYMWRRTSFLNSQSVIDQYFYKIQQKCHSKVKLFYKFLKSLLWISVLLSSWISSGPQTSLWIAFRQGKVSWYSPLILTSGSISESPEFEIKSNAQLTNPPLGNPPWEIRTVFLNHEWKNVKMICIFLS